MISVARKAHFVDVAKKVAVPLLLMLASFVFVSSAVSQHEQMSPFDEYVYIDYLAKVPEQGVVHRGEQTGELARQYYSCFGVEKLGYIAPQNCATGEYDNGGEYPFTGINSADIYTPLYFGATWVAAQPIMWVTGANLVDAGRLAGGLWLGAAAVMLHLGLRRLKASKLISAAAPLLMLSSVTAWWSNTYISTDATALLAGATLFYLGVRYVQSGKGSIALIAASGLAVAFKLQNFIAVVLTALFLMFDALSRRRRGSQQGEGKVPLRNQGPTIISMMIVPVLVQVTWMAIRSAIAVGGPADQQTATPLDPSDLLRESMKFFDNVGSTIPVDRIEPVGWALTTALSWVLVAGALSAVAIEARWSTKYSMAMAWILTALTAGPALAIATRITEGYYFELPARYGISLLPVAMALAASLLDRKKETQWVFASFAAITFIASLTPFYPGAQSLG